MLSKNLEDALHRALDYANEQKHEFATLEHLLLALTDDEDAQKLLSACDVKIDVLSGALQKYIKEDLAHLVGLSEAEAKPTAGFQRVIQRSIIHVQSSGRAEVNGANIIVALFSERESHAVFFLREQDMSRFDAVNFISHGIEKRISNSDANPNAVSYTHLTLPTNREV